MNKFEQNPIERTQFITTPKKRSILGNLGLALATTPMVAVIGLVIITVIGALDDAITKIQSAGYWWVILIIAYVLSLIYFLYEPTFRRNRERGKIANGLIFYWKVQLAKQNKPQPSDKEIEEMREIILERIKVWAWFDPELWSRHFPNEKYSEWPFGIVDNFMAETEKLKRAMSEPLTLKTAGEIIKSRHLQELIGMVKNYKNHPSSVG